MLTAVDLTTLQALTWQVRLMSEPQLETLGTGISRIRRLVRSGYIEPVTVLVRPHAIEAPLIDLGPRDPEPHYGKVSYVLKRRQSLPCRPTRAFVATEKASALVGGRGGPLRHPFQADHDHAVASVFIHYLRTAPEVAATWLGEDAIPRVLRKRIKVVPDAVTFGAGGAMRVEEFGGAYDADRLEALCRWSIDSGLSYRVW